MAWGAVGRTVALLKGISTLRGLVILIALIAPALVLTRAAILGISLDGDSIAYIAAARNLSAGNGLTLYDASPLTLWPPLFPTILALPDLVFGLDPLLGARIINAAIFGLIVLSASLLFGRFVAAPFLVVIGTAVVALSPDLLRLSSSGLSEPTFILLTLVFLLGVNTYQRTNATSSVVLISVVAGLACLTRYIGVTLILTGALVILLQRRSESRTKLLHLLLFGVIATAPLAVWAARNFLLAGAPLGSRPTSRYSLSYNLYYALVFGLNWFFPVYFIGVTLKSRGALAVFAAISGYLAGTYLKPKEIWRLSRRAVYNLEFIPLFLVIYVSFLVISSTITAFHGIHYRLMSPAFIPSALVLLFFIEQKFMMPIESFPIKLFGLSATVPKASVIVVILSAFIAISAGRVSQAIVEPIQAGINYNHVSWRISETVQY